MKTIIALGGTEIGPLLADGGVKANQLESVHREILAKTGKQRPRVLYVPTAKNDREDYIAGFKYYYARLGCGNVDVLRLLAAPPPSRAEIKAKIDAADVIYVNGGNTSRMIAWWKRRRVDELVKAAYRKGTVMAGHSAGAICWFDYGNSDSFYKGQPFRVTGLGIIPALLCPHYDSEPVRQAALRKMMRRTPHRVALTLDEAAAIEIIDDQYRILASDNRAAARRAYWRRGEYIVEPVAQTRDLSDLKPLLTKP